MWHVDSKALACLSATFNNGDHLPLEQSTAYLRSLLLQQLHLDEPSCQSTLVHTASLTAHCHHVLLVLLERISDIDPLVSDAPVMYSELKDGRFDEVGDSSL